MRGVTIAVAAAVAAAGHAIHNLGTLPAPFDKTSYAVGLDDQGDVIGVSGGRGAQRAFLWRNGKLRELPGFGGWTQPFAINNRGDVAGESMNPSNTHHDAVLWRNGNLVDLGTLGGRVSGAVDVNDSDWVVGTSETSTKQSHAFLWRDGTMTDLGTLGGEQSSAVAINDHGQVIGTSTTAGGATHAFLWQDGAMTDLGSFGNEDSVPTAINERGEVVGYVHPSIYDPDHAVLWKDGRIHDLGSFGGAKVKQAVAINDRGEILVNTFRPDHHAFLWRSGKATDLGSLGHPFWTIGHDLNDRGEIVGQTQREPRGPAVPFLWQRGRFTVLPTLSGAGPPTSDATRINERGEVAGDSYVVDGDRAVLWR